MRENKEYLCLFFAVAIIIALIVSIMLVCGEDSGTETDNPSDELKNVAGINETIRELVVIKDKSDYNKAEVIASLESDFRKKVNVSADADSETLAEDIYLNLLNVLPTMSGVGKNPVYYNITLDQLPQNPAISMPEYLGRNYGLTINIECREQSGKITDTAWWYTRDATRIAKAIFDNKIGSKTGILGIVFNEPEKEKETCFILYAADAEQLRPYWDEEGGCIKFSDWSSVETGINNLVMYEDPSSSVSIPPGILSGPYSDYSAGNTDADSLISESSKEILLLFDEVNRVVDEKNYDKIVSSSETLLSKCHLEREKFNSLYSYINKPAMAGRYIEILDLFSAAGSEYWYGAVYLDLNNFYAGNKYFMDGVEMLDEFTETSGESFVLKGQVSEIVPSTVVNYQTLNTPVHYRDAGNSNDLSINAECYQLARNLYLKDGNNVKTLKSKYGSIFVAVVVDVYHLGYRGGGTEKITTPSKNDFVLIYDGIEYKDITPNYYIRNIGETYQQKTLNRLEHYEANVIYEIEYDGEFNPDLASFKADLGNDWGEQIWMFEES